MDVVGNVERPFGSFPGPELSRQPVGALASTIPLTAVGTTPLTTTTTVTNCASIILPENLTVTSLGLLVCVAGTATGTWLALLDNGLRVRGVTANSAGLATGFQNVALGTPFVTPYAGLYYVAYGTVSTVAPQVAAQAAGPTVAGVSGPPVYAGTTSTAASTTPPAVGAVLGALTGVAAAEFYAQIL